MADRVRAALTDDLRRAPWRGSENPMAGHCYVASESYYHLAPGCKPMTVRHEGSVHWYLTRNGETIDLTADQFDTPVPYHLGVGRGFLTRAPSKRAARVIERVIGNEDKSER
jgi:hypothetical protein